MADCYGELPLSTRVDQSMKDFIDAEADRCGVNRAELVRRVFDDFRASRAGQLDCPECGEEVHINPCP